MPILAPAPARFSTITVWPSACCNGDCKSRANTSEDPAGANGTMIRIGRLALSCACAGRGSASAAAASRVRNERRYKCPPSSCGEGLGVEVEVDKYERERLCLHISHAALSQHFPTRGKGKFSFVKFLRRIRSSLIQTLTSRRSHYKPPAGG